MEDTFPGSRSVVDQAFEVKGVPFDAREVMRASITESTWRQYNSALKVWWEFCKENQVPIITCSVPFLLNFFVTCFNQGKSFGTLR